MRIVKLTCETLDCVNQNRAIELPTDATQYMCGACSQFITNVEEVTDGTDEEAN